LETLRPLASGPGGSLETLATLGASSLKSYILPHSPRA
jgi:hypothetical protein